MTIAKFHDGLNFLSKLTIPRVLNTLNVVGSFYLSKWSGNVFHSGMPLSISIEPTTSCNLRCPQCPSGLRAFTRNTGMLNPAFFKSTIDQIHNKLLYLIFYFQGEPFLNKDFPEMVKYASMKNIYTATSTNGHFLNDENARSIVESGLDRIIISIDGITQDAYEQYRVGGSLHKVLEGSKNLVRWKRKLKSKTPHIIFQFLVIRHNEHQAGDIYTLAKEIGVDEVVLKTAQIYDFKNGSDLIPVNAKYARYAMSADGSYAIKNKLLNHCWKLWHSCVITWDGMVVPCCFDKDALHKMGDLKTQSFRKLWHNETYRKFRGEVLRTRSEIEMCSNCTEGTTVWT